MPHPRSRARRRAATQAETAPQRKYPKRKIA